MEYTQYHPRSVTEQLALPPYSPESFSQPGKTRRQCRVGQSEDLGSKEARLVAHRHKVIHLFLQLFQLGLLGLIGLEQSRFPSAELLPLVLESREGLISETALWKGDCGKPTFVAQSVQIVAGRASDREHLQEREQ